MFRSVAALCASVLLVTCVSAGAWWLSSPAAVPEGYATELPAPTFPPRITEGSTYEACLTTLASDPISAVGIAEAWQENGGGDGASTAEGWRCADALLERGILRQRMGDAAAVGTFRCHRRDSALLWPSRRVQGRNFA